MSDYLVLALVTLALGLAFAFGAKALDRWLQVHVAERKSENLSDDNPNNDGAFDDLEDDLAKDTEPWKK